MTKIKIVGDINPHPAIYRALSAAIRKLPKYKKMVRDYLQANPKCVRCWTEKDLHVDHIIPLKFGGAVDDSFNLQALCRDCHYGKSAEDVIRCKNLKPDITKLLEYTLDSFNTECIECGKMFIPEMTTKQKTCSAHCRDTRQARQNREYQAKIRKDRTGADLEAFNRKNRLNSQAQYQRTLHKALRK